MTRNRQCMVKGCCNERTPLLQLCRTCYNSLNQGVPPKAGKTNAWFAMELEFMHTQYHAAMEEVGRLHDKLNEVIDDG